MSQWTPCVLDLDGSVARQDLLPGQAVARIDLRGWGERIRLACSKWTFRAFERSLAEAMGSADGEDSPWVAFCGSGDFHHVSLALVRQVKGPFNLLVIDKHPDCIRGVPFLHCGTWLRHAMRLPNLRRVFHVGGEMDFDNAWRLLLPWPEIRRQKIVFLPAWRRFTRGKWKSVEHWPLRAGADQEASAERVAELLQPWRAELAACPLYVSLDKDSLCAAEAVVNWDSSRCA